MSTAKAKGNKHILTGIVIVTVTRGNVDINTSSHPKSYGCVPSNSYKKWIRS